MDRLRIKRAARASDSGDDDVLFCFPSGVGGRLSRRHVNNRKGARDAILKG